MQLLYIALFLDVLKLQQKPNTSDTCEYKENVL